MPTTTSDTDAAVRDLESLGQSLCSRIAAGHFEEARKIADACMALDSPATHQQLLALLERARRLTIAQRSLAATRLANLETSNRYKSPTDTTTTRYVARG